MHFKGFSFTIYPFFIRFWVPVYIKKRITVPTNAVPPFVEKK